MATSTVAPHLRILNPRPSDNVDHEAQFTFFQQLPKELRLKIWEHSLYRQRIIKLRLEPRQYSTREELPGIKRQYEVIAEGWYHMSKLFRVNSESRAACMSFYRAHIPCWLHEGRSRSEQEVPGMLYFNPEFDFLYLAAPSALPAKETFFEFLHHLKTVHDPRGVGLLNLSISSHFLDQSDLKKVKASDLEPDVRESVVQTLSQLREVFLVSITRDGRRRVGTDAAAGGDLILNRSFPVTSARLDFERLSRDPRPIAGDLQHVFCQHKPVNFFNRWKQFVLQKFGLDGSTTQHQYLVANGGYVGRDRRVYSRGDMESLLQNEFEQWIGAICDIEHMAEKIQDQRVMGMMENARMDTPKEADLTNGALPAVGFWLFPIQVFFDLPDQQRWSSSLDLSGSWPELCMTILPD
ncbi:hypothetical protein F5Y15DRAFT_94994 [Xylariaceae sp. FL0016]|nr:hypothetical protein F5Y15DRAFT_94994 [Xylariaceae sp. FL0016]